MVLHKIIWCSYLLEKTGRCTAINSTTYGLKEVIPSISPLSGVIPLTYALEMPKQDNSLA